MELGRLERKFAYGVDTKKIKGESEHKEEKRSKRSRWSKLSCRGKNSRSRKSKKINIQSMASRNPTDTVSGPEGNPKYEVEESIQSESSVQSMSRHPVMEYPETEGHGLDTISEVGPSYQMVFNALKDDESMKLELRVDAQTRRPGLYGSISVDDQMVECRLKEIKPVLKTGRMGVLKVVSVTVCAVRCDNGQNVERVLKRDQ